MRWGIGALTRRNCGLRTWAPLVTSRPEVAIHLCDFLSFPNSVWERNCLWKLRFPSRFDHSIFLEFELVSNFGIRISDGSLTSILSPPRITHRHHRRLECAAWKATGFLVAGWPPSILRRARQIASPWLRQRLFS